jgi:N-acetylmuramoyl-L-alanine amidase
MTFILDRSGDDLAARFAARENSASLAAGHQLASLMSAWADPANRDASQHFAGLLQKAAVASLEPVVGRVPDRGVKRAGFYVLAGARMPAVLFETSFISNPSEEALLNSAEYRQKLADAVFNAVRAYRDGV